VWRSAPVMAAGRPLDFGPVWDQREALARGVWTMLVVAAAALVLSVIGGAAMALLRRSRIRPLSWLAFAYIQFFRGVALYVLIVWVFFGLAVAAGVRLDPIPAGIVTLTLLNTAYLAEVFRAGLEAVPRGQSEAADAIGLSRWARFRFVVAPQAVRVALPAAGNQFADIIKDSAILSVVGVSELFRETQRWSQFYQRPFEFYTAAAAIYLTVVLIVSGGVRLLERRLAHGVGRPKREVGTLFGTTIEIPGHPTRVEEPV
jgi:His/Glu/Gln/Arg/opine family amino acid ABC transporter permease subunit